MRLCQNTPMALRVTSHRVGVVRKGAADGAVFDHGYSRNAVGSATRMDAIEQLTR